MEKVEDDKTLTLSNVTDSVDLSNACREFYQARRKTAEIVKEKLASSRRQQKTKTSLDSAITVLRTEMVSLMDKDLCLMKQLLCLNESIEDLKWQRNNSYSQTILDSSCDLSESDWSVSETDMYESESDVEKLIPKQSSISKHPPISFPDYIRNQKKLDNANANHDKADDKEMQRLPTSGTKVATKEESEPLENKSKTANRLSISLETRKFLGLSTELEEFLNGPSSSSDEENSFDSGINETEFWPEVAV